MRSIGAKAARYIISGGSAAIVDTSVFSVMLWLGVPVPVGATISFVVASVWNYSIAAPFVFGARRSIRGYLRFVSAASLGLVINVGLTSWLPGPLAVLLPPPLVAVLPPLPIVAKVIAIGLAFGINFTINLLVVFRVRETR